MDSKGFDATPKSVAKQAGQLGKREVEERLLPSCFKLSRQPASEIRLDLRATKWPKMIGCGRGSVDRPEHAAVFFKLFRIRQSHKKFVGKTERQSLRGFHLLRQAW